MKIRCLNFKINKVRRFGKMFLTHNNKDVNGIFNVLLNTYIRIFYSCFLSKNIIKNSNKKICNTKRIRTSNKKGGGTFTY